MRKSYKCSKYWQDVICVTCTFTARFSTLATQHITCFIWAYDHNKVLKAYNWTKDMTVYFIILNQPTFQRLIRQFMLLSDNKCLTTLEEVVSRWLKIASNTSFHQIKPPLNPVTLGKNYHTFSTAIFFWATVTLPSEISNIYSWLCLINCKFSASSCYL